jgi:hypothetical protein
MPGIRFFTDKIVSREIFTPKQISEELNKRDQSQVKKIKTVRSLSRKYADQSPEEKKDKCEKVCKRQRGGKTSPKCGWRPSKGEKTPVQR